MLGDEGKDGALDEDGLVENPEKAGYALLRKCAICARPRVAE